MRIFDDLFLPFFDHLFHLGAGQFGPFLSFLEFPVIEVVLCTIKQSRNRCRIRSDFNYLFHQFLSMRKGTEGVLLLGLGPIPQCAFDGTPGIFVSLFVNILFEIELCLVVQCLTFENL